MTQLNICSIFNSHALQKASRKVILAVATAALEVVMMTDGNVIVIVGDETIERARERERERATALNYSMGMSEMNERQRCVSVLNELAL